MIQSTNKVPLGINRFLEVALPQHVKAGFMRFEAIRKIGAGGKAEVILCRDVNLGHNVAVKVLNKHLMGSEIEQQMLVREARIMVALACPGIPKIYDLGRDFEARPYYAMGFVEGKSLREILQHSPTATDTPIQQFELLKQIDILTSVAGILSHAHDKNIVHCDLKPDNLIVTENGPVCVIDWGLAIWVDENATLPGVEIFYTQRGRQGSPLYMAPEQILFDEPIGPATDIYAMGVLLYECLTSKTPFASDTVDDTFNAILSGQPLPPSALSTDRYLPASLERVCLKAMSRQPTDRHLSMDEFADELRDCRLDILMDYEITNAGSRNRQHRPECENLDHHLAYV